MNKKHFRARPLLVLLTVFVALTAKTSCKVKKSRLNGAITHRLTGGGNEKNDILINDSVHFTRSKDFTSGTLFFKTNIQIKCEFSYWTKSTQNHPQTKTCQQDAGTDFSENITPIPYNENLTIKLYYWPLNQTKSEDLTKTLEENADFSAVTLQQFIAGRFIMPLKSMEVYEINLDTPKKIADLSTALTMKAGCSATKTTLPNPYSEPNKPLVINNLSTTGFLTGSASADPQDKNRLSIYFDLLQTGQEWTWTYKYNNTDHRLITKAPGYLNSLKIVGGGSEYPIKNKNLALIDDSVTLSGSEKEIDWDPQNLADGALVFVQYKGQKTGTMLTCIFPAADHKGTIPDDLMGKLPADVYDFLAVLQSSQIVPPTDGESPTWIITAQDWRFSKLAWKTTL